jgi:flagellin-like protein
MNIRDRLGGQNRGVSPVIAVILMVAITVILASVVGTFVLDVGSSLSDPMPQASFSVEQNEMKFAQGQDNNDGNDEATQVINITHSSGEEIEKRNIYLTVNDERAYSAFEAETSNGLPSPTRIWHGDGTIRAGDTAHVAASIPTSLESPDEVVNRQRDWEWTDHGLGYYTLQLDDTSDTPLGHDSAIESGDVVRIIYDSGNGNSQILYEYTVA